MWTALFNHLFARQRAGTFVLRIEDTDQKRLIPGTQERIIEALDWYGLTPDEGPVQGGPYGPYIQSQRLEIYRQHALQLVKQGSAYYCFCTSERLDALRAEQSAAKLPPKYDKRCAALDPAEARRRAEAGESAVVRINVPTSGQIVHRDIIRGDVTFSWAEIDDSVLLKSDGYPTYHLANVVDDHLMEITHVIRAEEWLPSTPKHLLLYRTFGWTPPQFAHLPLLLGPDKSKLSKRHGATSALSFRDEGYVPEAMRNFLVLMGWHPKGDDEILDDDRVRREFSLQDVHPAGAVFDRMKLDWLNGRYLRRMDPSDLAKRLEAFWPEGKKLAPERRTALVSLVRDRMKKLSEIRELASFGFSSVWDLERKTFDQSILVSKQGDPESTRANIKWFTDWTAAYSADWTAASLKTAAISAISRAGRKNGDVLWPARVGLTLRSASPDVFDVMGFLGREETLRRLKVWE